MLNSAIWQGGTLKIAQTVSSARHGVYLYILENYQTHYLSGSAPDIGASEYGLPAGSIGLT